MTGSGDGSPPTRKQRPGVCHRCGWTQSVSKVGRIDRHRLSTSFRRLCNECLEDLHRGQAGKERGKTAHKARLRILRDRDVA
jgi:hypothetical protein